ncbi:MAG: SRPBCC family protein [Rhodospirillaceae bacterium]|nr:SRPBCC family protein [Rhodospirillaceae bacterium]
MRIADSFVVQAPIDRTWTAITDPAIVGTCMPGCEEIETVSDTFYRAKVRIKIGPISAIFALKVEVLEEQPPTRIVFISRGKEGDRASKVQAENTLTLEPLDGGATKVLYESEVLVTGRLAKFGFGMMKKKAQSLAEEFASSLEDRLNAVVNG